MRVACAMPTAMRLPELEGHLGERCHLPVPAPVPVTIKVGVTMMVSGMLRCSRALLRAQ